MASIYDWANITAGDPIGRVERAAGEASANLEQYKHNKEMIEEINAAYQAAQDKMKKGKKGFGLGGSLLGGLLSTFVPGAPVIAAILSGGSAALAEKVRQNRYDPTKELEKIDEKYKGRKLGEGIGSDIEEIEDQLSSSILTDAITSSLSSYALGNLEFAPGETTEILSSEEVVDNLIEENFVSKGLPDIADADGNVWQIVSEPAAEDSLYGFTEGYSPGTDIVQNFDPNYVQTAVDYTTGPPSLSMSGLDEEALNSLAGMKGIDISKILEKINLDSPFGQTIRGLLRYGGTPLLQDLMMPEFQAPQMAAAPFRNPFGGY